MRPQGTMPTRPDPPTWKIFSTAGGQFQWASAGSSGGSSSEAPPDASAPEQQSYPSSRLPSMADLVLQASVELVDRSSGDEGGAPMFRTGTGRSVSVKESSMQKAASLLSGDVSEKGTSMIRNGGGCDEEFPMFRTGLGKSVMISRSSMRKAASVLEGENSEEEFLKLLDVGRQDSAAPKFQTGSGKSIMLKQSSIKKALAVLDNGGNVESDQAHQRSLNQGCSFSNSPFQTGSGRIVDISSSGLLRATTLLGLDGNHKFSSSDRFVGAMGQSDSDKSKSGTIDDKVCLNVNPESASTFRIGPMDETSSFANSKDSYKPGGQSNTAAQKIPPGSEASKISHYDLSPIKFHTAGGRSISVSTDALHRAKRLLGNSNVGVLQGDMKVNKPLWTYPDDDKAIRSQFWNKENLPIASVPPYDEVSKRKAKMPPCVQTITNHQLLGTPFRNSSSPSVILDPVNSHAFVCEGLHSKISDTSSIQKRANKGDYMNSTQDDTLITNYMASGEPLIDITNIIGAEHANESRLTSEKKRFGRKSTISPFKRPRSSRFTAPLNVNHSFHTAGSSVQSTSENCFQRRRLSSHYPPPFKQRSIKDFFGGPPIQTNLTELVPEDVRRLTADNAEKYRFRDASGLGGFGPDDFQVMLLQSGASPSSATKEWVANHYKWVAWKLASLERCYVAQASGKFLTVSNMLAELKYRYDREFNYGHRSAVKKILDGDASPASAVILCISAIRFCSEAWLGKMDEKSNPREGNAKLSGLSVPEGHHSAKIELTDGWYSLGAVLDTPLSRKLIAKKLFVGQKLRILGAGLCGWVAPVSPLETSDTVNLLIHINGTYRAHWADSLGFCKGPQAPLAFRCIKGTGGKVPRALAGVTRIYPVLYKEKFPDGGSIVRSERMEREVLQLYNQRRSCIAEDIISEHQGMLVNDEDSEEGAKIFRILQNAAEPEVLMADMTSEQLISFSAYQEKQEAVRQSELHKRIEKALEDAGLGAREVTSFMRVKVMGLTTKGASKKFLPREGLITIWNPSEQQKNDLVEGQMYSVEGLMPLNLSADIIYLQGRGSSTRWVPLPSEEIEKFEPFFTPRKSVLLSNLGEVPLASEFDVAAVIVHVGEAYLSGRQKKQWVFMTDGSSCSCDSRFEEPYNSLLAVSFCSPIVNNDSSALLGNHLPGTAIGLCNLVKRARDKVNHLWVAEATENSTYSVYYNLSKGSHLKEAADSAQKWAKQSYSTIQKLQERVLCIVGRHGT